MTVDVDELEKLARAATPGPWYVRGGTHGISTDVNGGDRKSVVASAARYEDVDFIAAANPAVVRALIAELDRARGEVLPRERELVLRCAAAEAIVRELAGSTPDVDDGGTWCAVCETELHLGWPSMSEHRDDCPWRRAVEATQPKPEETP